MTMAGALDVIVAALAAIPPAEWAGGGARARLPAARGAAERVVLGLRDRELGDLPRAVRARRAGHAGRAAGVLHRHGRVRLACMARAIGAPGDVARVALERATARARHRVALVVSVVNGWIVARAQGGLVPYVDAFVAWASVLATWMVARKVLENWLYWIVVDSGGRRALLVTGLSRHGGLFVLYVVIAVRGYLAWRADLARNAASARGRACLKSRPGPCDGGAGEGELRALLLTAWRRARWPTAQ
jgi:hypothetical protein